MQFQYFDLRKYIETLFKDTNREFDFPEFYDTLGYSYKVPIIRFLSEELSVSQQTIRSWGTKREYVPEDQKPSLEKILGFNPGELFSEKK